MTGKIRTRRAVLYGTAIIMGLMGEHPARAGAETGVGEKPQRIVSLNVCTDQLLLALGARDRLVSVTFLAADPASSPMADAARGIPSNRGRAEEILPLRPDLVLAGAAAATPTVALLRRLGKRVVVVPLARSLKDIPRNIAIVAGAIGEEARGNKMVARFRRDLDRLTMFGGRGRDSGPRPVALLFGPNGVTSGEGTLAGSVIEATGLGNAAAGMGLAGVGRMPLETALGLSPDLLIVSGLRGDHPSLATGLLEHPALAAAFEGRAHVRIEHHVWACGTPRVLEAVRRLTAARRTLRADGKGSSP